MVAGSGSAVTVNAKLEPLAVNVVAQGLHAARKTVGVVGEFAVCIAVLSHPVVVKVQVNVARIF